MAKAEILHILQAGWSGQLPAICRPPVASVARVQYAGKWPVSYVDSFTFHQKCQVVSKCML